MYFRPYTYTDHFGVIQPTSQNWAVIKIFHRRTKRGQNLDHRCVCSVRNSVFKLYKVKIILSSFGARFTYYYTPEKSPYALPLKRLCNKFLY